MLEVKPFFGHSIRSRLCRLNPFCWSKRTLRVVTTAFFLILLPLYIFIGVNPASSVDYSAYPTLEIPDIALSTPVAALELQDRQLIAPATIAGSYYQNPSKTLLIGHSSTVFRRLHQIQPGSNFSYQGKSYTVSSVVTLAKSDIDMAELLSPTPVETVVIMTCAGDPLPNQDATHRLIVTATIESSNDLASR